MEIKIKKNNGILNYQDEDLKKKSRFLRFAYKIRKVSPLEVGIFFSEKYGDECTIDYKLKTKQNSISFPLAENLEKDIEYFKEKYLSSLPETPIFQREYKVDSIILLDDKRNEYRINLDVKDIQEFDNPDEYWKNTFEKIQPWDIVELWESLNSLYSQIRESKNDLEPYNIYLRVLQENLVDAGSKHIGNGGSVLTNKRFPLNKDIFENRCYFSRDAKPFLYVEDLKQAVFFNPLIHVNILKNKPSIRIRTRSLIDLK